jgi:hypothetical protein
MLWALRRPNEPHTRIQRGDNVKKRTCEKVKRAFQDA